MLLTGARNDKFSENPQENLHKEISFKKTASDMVIVCHFTVNKVFAIWLFPSLQLVRLNLHFNS